jgi:hypothetical protein
MAIAGSAGPYADFLARKTQLDGDHGFDPIDIPEFLFPFQAALVTWALRKGRGAVFADCGLGKTPMELVWAQNVYRHTGRPVLIAAPLAVTFQVASDASKFGIEAAISRDGVPSAPITITNYERLHQFDPDVYVGMACDESSAIKAFDGVRRAIVTEFMRRMPYRLLGTATAAPNDHVELGTSSEALGYLGYMDMLSRFFTNKERSSAAMGGRYARGDRTPWRLKGHAEHDFWRWVSSWARAIRRPSDLGFPDDGYCLPDLDYRQHLVCTESTADDDALFALPATTLAEEQEELRRTVPERSARAAELLGDADFAVAWCQRNDESALLAKLIDGAVEVRGSDPADAKEEALLAFTRGEVRVLVTKPTIGGWGLNWQHCHRMTFFPSHSYEQQYQAVRRCWRFGQRRPVRVDIITTPGGSRALANVQRKAAQAEKMFAALVAHMRDAVGIARADTYDKEVEVPPWLAAPAR